jgi:hypothetical protein
MSLEDYTFDKLLPPYLTNTDKGRIRAGLDQFLKGKDEIDYSEFYSYHSHSVLMQSDLIHSIISIDWDEENRKYKTGYTPGILISNSCDVSLENKRHINNKEALFAPIIPLQDYLKMAREDDYSDRQISGFYDTLTKQEYTNLFYLPPNHINGRAYIVRLDKIWWVPQTELIQIFENIDNSRLLSLSDWAYYLFLTKLSLHTCRVPEEIERRNSL